MRLQDPMAYYQEEQENIDLSSQIKNIKRELKEWERSFAETEGRRPYKEDIAQDKSVQRRYKLYARLKRAEKDQAVSSHQTPANGGGDDDEEALQSPDVALSPSREDWPSSSPVNRTDSQATRTKKSKNSQRSRKDPIDELDHKEERMERSHRPDRQQEYSQQQCDDDEQPRRAKSRNDANVVDQAKPRRRDRQDQDDDRPSTERSNSRRERERAEPDHVKPERNNSSRAQRRAKQYEEPEEPDEAPHRHTPEAKERGSASSRYQDGQEMNSRQQDELNYDPASRPSLCSPPPPVNTEPAPAPWRKRDSLSRVNSTSPPPTAFALPMDNYNNTSSNKNMYNQSSSPTSPASASRPLSPSSPSSSVTAPSSTSNNVVKKADLPVHFKLKRTTIAPGPISTADIEAGISPASALTASSDSRPSSANPASPAEPVPQQRGVLISGPPVAGSEYQEFVNRRRQMEALAAQQYEKERERELAAKNNVATVTAASPTINSNTNPIMPLAIKPISVMAQVSVGPPPLPSESHRNAERHLPQTSNSSNSSVASREASATYSSAGASRPPPAQPIKNSFVGSTSSVTSPKDAVNTSQSIFVKAVKRPSIDHGDIVTLDSPGSGDQEEELDADDVDLIVPMADPPSNSSRRDSMSPLATEGSTVASIAAKGVPIINPKLFKRLSEEGVLRCRLVRKSTGIYKAHPAFFLYNEADDRFLLAARKRLKSKNVAFLISNAADDMTKDGQHYIAKLKANTQRTVFTLYDARYYSKAAPNKGLKELSCITYSKTVLPREMQVAIPAMYIEEGSDDFSKDVLADTRAQNTSKLHFLRNKPPRWNEATQSHCLNFGGRVTLPSIKNFQLIADAGDEAYIVMQFGRCGQDLFALDARYPLTPVEAFSIALSTFTAYDSA
ncbi:hypothetical protein SmJEL517_g00205 [Synchytrium microbalum]|uniref:Tubby C-terminal domain-containing protein n=1 Tax=Synchytrium microbalum TaxID=1806994 RepID=A0A507CFQ1_9FUNG|nr:uncharacterized protein SmJEL517_g00205 [Synchytrium microbalum]TPX38188.1 hypothetical protein SmJEL517_g00205 [Synchytrium microbalum]